MRLASRQRRTDFSGIVGSLMPYRRYNASNRQRRTDFSGIVGHGKGSSTVATNDRQRRTDFSGIVVRHRDLSACLSTQDGFLRYCGRTKFSVGKVHLTPST